MCIRDRYTTKLIALVEKHGFRPHLYADDTQVYGRCTQAAIPDVQQRLSACIDEVHSWMRSNQHQLNVNKSIIIIIIIIQHLYSAIVSYAGCRGA